MESQILPLLTREAGSAQRIHSVSTESLETAFLIPGFRGLWLNASGWSNKATVYFAFETVRNPDNLKNLVQRILHHIACNDAEQVFGALIDLFIVLKNKGKALKERMLNNAQQTLKKKHYAALQQLMAYSSSPEPDDYPESRHSVLSKGADKLRPLIEIIQIPDLTTPLESIDTDIVSAENTSRTKQEKLEAVLLDGSTDYQLHKQLTELYKSTGDKNAFIHTFSKIEIQERDLIDLWWEAYDYFKAEES